jgi:lipoprotein-releasing system permease protein
MFGAFERMVAGRYLRARKGERFVSIIAIFSLIGIALGVATLIVVTSVMSGFQTELESRVLGINGHISIEAYGGDAIDDYQGILGQMRAVPGVTSILPVLDGQALLSTEHGGATGGLVRGVTLQDLHDLHAISDHIVAGSLNDFAGDDAIVVGVGLATSNQLQIGDSLTIISPKGAATAFGTIPRVKAYKIVAIFDAGLAQYNSSVVFLPLPLAQIFFQQPNAVTGFQIRVADPERVQDQVPAFNVISSLIMLVKDKTADIAVMRTIGASSGAILRIFLMCGAFVGVTGTVIGTAIGIVFCRNIVAIQHAVERITGGQVFDSNVFLLSSLPSDIDWTDVGKVIALGLVLSLLATLYPSWKAAKTDPVKALRNG